jgi:hypothetical protein
MNTTMTKANIFYGWWIIAAGFVLLFLFAGAGFYSFSIFIKPLEDEFSWARASISLTMSIYFSFWLVISGHWISEISLKYEKEKINKDFVLSNFRVFVMKSARRIAQKTQK